MFERILVATDGSVHSRRAAVTAASLARALGASLTLLVVYQLPPGFEGEPDYSRDLEAALGRAHALLEVEAAAIEADGGPRAETEAIGGS
jgi:nucleotide-binding universal stress UspA family protein